MISVIVPSHNEADRVGATIRALWDISDRLEVVVVDDGSTDSTMEAARAAGARVIRLPENRGKGAALQAGVIDSSGDVLVLLDADLGESAAQAKRLIAPVLADEADMTIATFPVIPGKGGGFGLVVTLARWGIRRATRLEMAAPLSGQRALRRAVWQGVGGFAPGFCAEVALTIDAVCAGYRVMEVPTTMTHRVTGRDWRAIAHRARQFVAVARALWARRKRRC